MEIEELFGLPAHPLVVHAAVVLVPLTAIGALACLHPGVRRRLGVVVAVFALISMFAVWLAEGTGEALEEQVDETELVEEHAELAEGLLPWVALMAVSTIGLVGVDEWQRRRVPVDADAPVAEPSWMKPVGIGLAVVIAITSIGSFATVVEVGHSGAKATWSEEGEGGERLEGGEEREGSDDDGHGESGSDEDEEGEDEGGMAPLVTADAAPPTR